MRFVWLSLLTIGFSFAEDNQLSVFVQYPHVDLAEVDTGVLYEAALGRYAMVGIGLASTTPSNNHLTVSLRSRLTLQPNSMQQWYPSLMLQQDLQAEQLSFSVGAGWQYPLSLAWASFAELDYSLGRSAQLRVGLRFAPSRWFGLDNRIRKSAPKGVTYRPGSMRNATAVNVEFDADSATLVTNESTMKPQPNSEMARVEPLPINTLPVPTVITGAESESLPEVAAQPPRQTTSSLDADSLQPGTYLSLGVFRYHSSLVELRDDRRLLPYQRQLIDWYDSERDFYRLLLRPRTEAELPTLQRQLRQLQLDSFVYRVDTGAHN